MRTMTVYHWVGEDIAKHECVEGLSYSWEDMVGYFRAAKDWLLPKLATETHHHIPEDGDLVVNTPEGSFVFAKDEATELLPGMREQRQNGYPRTQLARRITFSEE